MAAKPKNVVNVKPKKEKRARNIVILVAVSFILWGFFSLINFFTDWMWFDELGYVSVFLKKLTTQLKFGIPMFVVLSGLMYLYLTGLRRGYFKKIISWHNYFAGFCSVLRMGYQVCCGRTLV